MATNKIPADLRQEVRLNRWVEANGKVHEDLGFGYTSDEEPHIHLSTTKALRLGVAVAGEVTDDPDYDWEHLDVHYSKEDDEHRWDDDEDDNGDETRSFLGGEDVAIKNIHTDGTVGVTCGGMYYGAMPVGSVKVDLDTIQNSDMRQLASRMLAGAYTPTPPTEAELREEEAEA